VLPEWIVSRKPAPKKVGATAASATGDAGAADAVVDKIADSAVEDDAQAPRSTLSPAWMKVALGSAALAAAFTLLAMDRWTVDSTTPRPEGIPAIPDGIAEYAHKRGRHDVHGLLDMIDHGLLYMPGESSARVLQGLAERCRIVLLRGIGTDNALRLWRVGVLTRQDLAARNPDELTAALAELDEPGWTPKPRRVQVWVEGARRDLAGR
jgi:hypothetical protein